MSTPSPHKLPSGQGVFRIATWNINSIRMRLDMLCRWMVKERLDVIGLQETKVINSLFPKEAIEASGYHVVYIGERSFNGVALLSRWPITEVDVPEFKTQARRILVATIGGVRIVNIYAPNGTDIGSPQYADKLVWFSHLRDYLARELVAHPQLIVLGDFNVAPDDRDVYDPEGLRGSLLISIPERQAFQAILNLGFTDAFRIDHPGPQQYSFWDYRQKAFFHNHGWRLDHCLLSPSLLPCHRGCTIDRSLRMLNRPSDHTPVIEDLLTLKPVRKG